MIIQKLFYRFVFVTTATNFSVTMKNAQVNIVKLS